MGLILTTNDSGLFRMALFVVLNSCLCCCCLGPVLALEAKLCFFAGIRLCSSGCWVTFRLARDVDCVAGGLGLCAVLVAQKTNEYFCGLEKRKFYLNYLNLILSLECDSSFLLKFCVK